MARYPYDVPRQGVLTENVGRIDLVPGHDYATAAQDLEGIERIWLLFLFDRNLGHWRPKVRPPHHTSRKIGVFATRSPNRPNPIGISCVKLLKVNGNRIYIQGHDLLDGTPILDIKPYLPFADAFPDSAVGWIAEPEELYAVSFSPAAEAKVIWLTTHGVPCIREFITTQLSVEPSNRKRHRMVRDALAYRTWQADFTIDEDAHAVVINDIRSAYTSAELESTEDKYGDKEVHRQFVARSQF